jgi:hypothetical protein
MNGHLSSEELGAWIIGDRSREARKHIMVCADCRREVERLECALWQFRDSGQRWSEHWYSVRDARAPRMVWPWLWLVAAGGVVSVALLVLLAQRPAPTRFEEAPFLQIPYAGPLAPFEQTKVLRMDMTIAALKAAGFDIHAPELGGALTADVLVGQDGRAHAIRPVFRSVTR